MRTHSSMLNRTLEAREQDLRIRIDLGLPMVDDADDFLGACSEAIAQRDAEIEELTDRIDELEKELTDRIDELEKELDKEINAHEETRRQLKTKDK